MKGVSVHVSNAAPKSDPTRALVPRGAAGPHGSRDKGQSPFGAGPGPGPGPAYGAGGGMGLGGGAAQGWNQGPGGESRDERVRVLCETRFKFVMVSEHVQGVPVNELVCRRVGQPMYVNKQ